MVKSKFPSPLGAQLLILCIGFRHYAYLDHKLFFNGYTLEEMLKSHVNGVHAWVEKGGIVGRGILVDYAAWADANNIKIEPLSTHSIPVSVLEEVIRYQGLTPHKGDILFVRSGWGRAYAQLSAEEAIAMADTPNFPAIGVESSETTLRWIWDNDFAAVAGDAPSFEAWPCQNKKFWLHEWFLAGWGMPIGELFDLEVLSSECRKRGRYSFFFSSVPLKVCFFFFFFFFFLFVCLPLNWRLTLLVSRDCGQSSKWNGHPVES